MSSPRQLNRTVTKTADSEHKKKRIDDDSIGPKSDIVQQPSNSSGKKVQTARKSFPKARKSFPNATKAPVFSTVNRNDAAGSTTHNKEKLQINLHPPGKEAEIITLPPEVSLIRSPTNRGMSIHEAQEKNHRVMLAAMRKTFNEEPVKKSNSDNSISATCVPSSTTGPEAGDDFSEEELVPLKDKLSVTPQKTSFSGAENITATSTSKVGGVEVLCDVTPAPTLIESPKPSDDKRVDVPDVHSVTNHPPTPAPTPFKDEDINVEAAMAALHGEPLEESVGVTSTGFECKQSPDLKSKVNVNPPEQTESAIGAEPTIKPNLTEEAVEQPKLSPVKVTVEPSVHLPESPPETISTAKVEQTEKSEPKETSSSGKTGRRIRPVSRELESLYGDEGAANILREMEGKPHCKRRATKGATYAGSIDYPLSPSPRRRHERTKQDSESEKRKRKTRVQTPADQLQSQQDSALQYWEAVPSSTNKKKVVYAPRAMPPPSSGPKHGAHKRSSSESDLVSSPISKKKRHETAGSGTRPNGYKNESDASLFESDVGNTSEQTKEYDDFKEILPTYKDKFLHVIISPVSTTLHNSFNVPVLKELTVLFKKLKTDTKVKVVLITSAGSDFCRGVDLPSIINSDPNLREAVVTEIVDSIREFFMELASCEKILIGGLQGRVVGIGVAMLPYLDVTYASDKAVFCLPYGDLGQTTEGGLGYASTFGFKGMQAVTLMMYENCKLTAQQAQESGLIDSVLGLSPFNEALMPRVSAIVSTARDATLSNKRMRCFSRDLSFRRDLPTILELESKELSKIWVSDEFVKLAEDFLNQDFMA